ncbi:hypothetical protein C9E82_17910 [Paracoccus siganidrum]|uniref:Uncharacterized protein n=1 Tax=Paracoccus siganidrum TaxID=1276757 RepID=A0A419ACA0_9RHOB|nr:hypothetical protein D3P05_00585 [Paracoccus siganidrum]RMC30422.1 hypothetical protein C9E82_17910 [Paracoccus siganidrum]
MFKNLRRQPVRQREQAGAQKRQNGDPSGLDLFGRDQRTALFHGLHLGEISPRPNEARPLRRVIRRTGLCLGGLIAQVADIAAHRADQVVLAALSLRDHALAAQLLDPALREIEKPRDHADGLRG